MTTKIKPEAERLWLRCGDGGNYDDNGDDFYALVGMMKEFGVIGPITHWQQYGFSTDNFSGNDYVSLYWGDKDAQPTRALTADERAEVERLLMDPKLT